MLTQIKIMARLELQNIFGLNVLRFTKDTKAKRKSMGLFVVWIMLLLILMGYMGGLAFGLIALGMAEIIPAYLITIASLITFFFGIFKAGGVIFRKNGYDILCSLPISQNAIVVSRFLRLYVENLAIMTTVLAPGLAVYVWFMRPGFSFYLFSVLGMLLIPVAPVAASALLGALVTGISSRMKHKSLVEAGLSIALVVVAMAGTSKLTELEGEITAEMLQNFAGIVSDLLGKLYPPAIWIGRAIIYGDIVAFLKCIICFLVLTILVSAVVSVNFHAICRRLYSTSAKHNYQMERLKKNSVLASLYKREVKRYFSSGIYVSNTIIGPIMGMVLSGALLFVDAEAMMQELVAQGLPIDIDVNAVIPLLVAGVFCMMTTTATSISMEGKNWWIIKSLPLRTKDVLDAKILMNLSLMLPFYLISEVLLMMALKPKGLEILWIWLIPMSLILFSCVYGMTVNLHMPVMNWESEAAVVKQSAAAMVGGMGGFLLAIVCLVMVMLVPGEFMDLVNAGICVVLIVLTAVLYRKNNQADLKKI